MKLVKKLITTIILISIIASMFSIGASANNKIAYGAATVDTMNLNLRTGPGLSHAVIAALNEGDIVVILERTNSEWYHVNFHGIIGYVSTTFLRDVLTAENFSAIGQITGDQVNMRSRPAITSALLASYPEQTVMTVIGINNGWYKVSHDGQTGYVRSDFMTIINGTRASSSPAPSSSSSSSQTESAVTSAPPANLTLAQQVVDYALGFLGSKYVYGGSSPSGFDCSGFVSYVLKNFDISVSRSAHSQYVNNGVRVSKSELAPGDLLFFSSNGGKSVTHVGLYIGDDEFVHSSTSATGVIISRLDSAYYVRVWHGAKRVL